MPILHTLNKSASHTELTRQLREAITDQDSVLLIEDGVYHLLHLGMPDNDWHKIPKQIYALKEDVLCRGISITAPDVQLVSYPDFVALSTQYDKVVSWY